jgi:hypothetical protein
MCWFSNPAFCFYKIEVMNLIKLIITFFLIYLAFRLITMYLLPTLIKWYLKRFQQKFYEQNPHLRREQEVHKKGNTRVIIEEQQKSDKNIPDDIGEYIDYEDIKDENKPKE